MPSDRTPVSQLAYATPDQMLFGSAKRTVACGLDVTIGGGQVLPEVNFTLPPMLVREETMDKVRSAYREMVGRVLKQLEEQGMITVNGKTIVVLGSH